MKKNKSLTGFGNILRYEGYYAIPQFSAVDRCFYGKVLGIRDCIMFEGQSVEELEESLKDSVDEYIDQCREEGIDRRESFYFPSP